MIYIYIYIEMIDCGESDNIIEIFGKLDNQTLKTGLEVRYFVLFFFNF